MVWLVLAGGLSAFLGTTLMRDDTDKTVFLPGATSAGHHQIELACGACHSEAFADRDAVQTGCVACHGQALKDAKDDHPKSKFTDPRNADRVAVLDARYCATCHVEHRPEITSAMGVTVPQDFCVLCHSDIAEERESHTGMPFDTCASAGCHNFHDNRALYEDFLAKHLDTPDTQPSTLLTANFREIVDQLPDYPTEQFPLVALEIEDRDVDRALTYDSAIDADWLASAHAAAGVNCSACHVDADGSPDGAWLSKPPSTVCRHCHLDEVEGFKAGKHGMRLDAERVGGVLEPMSPDHARLPMKEQSLGESLSCQSCHAAHAYDTSAAVVDRCLGCHDDEHSNAFPTSPHYTLYEKERAGELPTGSGVTCATCHMPRLEKDYFWGAFTHHRVQHNQSETLRPNEKMLRPICLECHGLGFAINALADPALIRNNFTGRPSVHVESLDLARDRLRPE